MQQTQTNAQTNEQVKKKVQIVAPASQLVTDEKNKGGTTHISITTRQLIDKLPIWQAHDVYTHITREKVNCVCRDETMRKCVISGK